MINEFSMTHRVTSWTRVLAVMFSNGTVTAAVIPNSSVPDTLQTMLACFFYEWIKIGLSFLLSGENNIVLSCLVRVAVLGYQRRGDRVVMCHPMVPTTWPPTGPRLIIGVALPWLSWADSLLEKAILFQQNYLQTALLTLPQFWCIRFCRKTFLKYMKLGDLLITWLRNCERVGRE